MKTKILLLLLLTATMSFGQTRRIQLTYDTAGNQTKRAICMSGCNARMANPASLKDEKSLTQADLIPSDIEKVSYYPNPVREELYVKWENNTENPVEQIAVYSMTGQLLKRYENLNGLTTSTLYFSEYPTGFYEVILNYQNGEKKNLSIVKN
jgi:Secretion system C-terminal sorting domain